MDENMVMLTPCPFCGGKVKITDYCKMTYGIDTEAECGRCGMVFTYSQDFAGPKTAPVAIRPSFEELWNGRIKEGQI